MVRKVELHVGTCLLLIFLVKKLFPYDLGWDIPPRRYRMRALVWVFGQSFKKCDWDSWNTCYFLLRPSYDQGLTIFGMLGNRGALAHRTFVHYSLLCRVRLCLWHWSILIVLYVRGLKGGLLWEKCGFEKLLSLGKVSLINSFGHFITSSKELVHLGLVE